METDSPPAVNLLLEMLHEVLEPLGERRSEIMALVAHEMKTQPVISFVCDDKDNTWKLGEASPTDESTIIFAMVHGPDERTIVVYTFQATEGADEYSYKTQFFREVLYEPKMVQGPIHHDALFAELRAHLLEEDEYASAARVCLEAAEESVDDPSMREKLLEVAELLDPAEPAEGDGGQANGAEQPEAAGA